jgi:hypothetical protein
MTKFFLAGLLLGVGLLGTAGGVQGQQDGTCSARGGGCLSTSDCCDSLACAEESCADICDLPVGPAGPCSSLVAENEIYAGFGSLGVFFDSACGDVDESLGQVYGCSAGGVQECRLCYTSKADFLDEYGTTDAPGFPNCPCCYQQISGVQVEDCVGEIPPTPAPAPTPAPTSNLFLRTLAPSSATTSAPTASPTAAPTAAY